MDDSDFIVAELVGVSPSGTQFDVRIRVGKPLTENGRCACSVQLVGIDDKPRRIYGEEPMQAMFLAMKFVKAHLKMEEDRGVHFFAPGEDVNGEPFDWRQFWYGEGESAEN